MPRTALVLCALVCLCPTATPADPAAKPRVDLYGDPLPEGAVARLGTVRFRLPGHASSVNFSPDGKSLVTTGGDGLLVWEVATGRGLHRLSNGDDHRFSHAFLAPDHKTAATVHFDPQTKTSKIQLWEVATGKHLRDIDSHYYAALQFSPDGTRLAAYNSSYSEEHREDIIDIWDVKNAGLVRSWEAGQEGVVHAIFTRDGKTLITGGVDKSIRFWEVETGKELRRLEGSPAPVGYVGLSADEKRLVTIEQRENPPNTSPRCPPKSLPWYGENRIRVWNLDTGKALYEFVVERSKDRGVSGITSALFTPDGKWLISGGIDRKTRIWDLEKGIEAKQFDISSDWHAALSPDGRTFAAFDGARIRLLDLQTGKELLPELDPHIRVARAVPMPDGKSVATSPSREGVLDLWELGTGRRIGQIEGGGAGFVYTMVASEDGKSLLTVQHVHGKLFTWDLDSKMRPRELPTQETTQAEARYASLAGMAISNGGKLIALGDYAKDIVTLVDVETGKKLRELGGHTGGTRRIFFADGGNKLIVSCADHTIRAWDLTKPGEQPREFGPLGDSRYRGPVPVGGGPSHAMYAIDFSLATSLLVYAGEHGDFALFDANSGRKLCRLEAKYKRIQFLPVMALSSDGRHLAWCEFDGQPIHIVETAAGQERHSLPGHEGGLMSLAFSPDSKLLISAGRDSTGLVWDLLGQSTSPKDTLDKESFEKCWSTLASADAAAAYKAIWQLVASPKESVPFLAEKLKPVAEVDAKRIAALIAALDSEKFAEREQATTDLAKLGEAVEPALKKLLAGQPSAEAKRRAEELLAKLGGVVTNPEQLRTLRAIEALEHIGTPEAKQVLEKLAKGAAGARETEDARRSLARLEKQKK
jgi:WD40 repeat protein